MTSRMVLDLVKDARRNMQGAKTMLLLLRDSGVLDESTKTFPNLLSNNEFNVSVLEETLGEIEMILQEFVNASDAGALDELDIAPP